jgi:hypothetical protein
MCEDYNVTVVQHATSTKPAMHVQTITRHYRFSKYAYYRDKVVRCSGKGVEMAFCKHLLYVWLQALFDATASFGGYYLAGLASSSENFPFR